ncbi:MAG: TonB-dependent receptor, partial [Acidobacteriota bacterium]
APRWSVLLAYAFTDAEITADTAFPVGDRLVRVPEHGGRLAVRFRGEGRWGGLGLGLGLSAGSERELTLPNAIAAEGYHLFDLQASYEVGRATFGMSVVNVTDEDFFEPYQYLAQAVVIPTRPRSVSGSVRWVF